MSKEKTSGEVRDELFTALLGAVDYWKAQPCSEEEKLSNIVHTLFAIIDGRTLSPGCVFDLVVRAPVEDQVFWKSEGKDWYPDGANISSAEHLSTAWVSFLKRRLASATARAAAPARS
jgi:hypothetical protein